MSKLKKIKPEGEVLRPRTWEADVEEHNKVFEKEPTDNRLLVKVTQTEKERNTLS